MVCLAPVEHRRSCCWLSALFTDKYKDQTSISIFFFSKFNIIVNFVFKAVEQTNKKVHICLKKQNNKLHPLLLDFFSCKKQFDYL